MSFTFESDLVDRARRAGAEITVTADGAIRIKGNRNLPPELRMEIAAHKYAVMQHLYDRHYRGYYWLREKPEVVQLLGEARRVGAAVSLRLTDGGETSDLGQLQDACGAYVRPGKVGIPESIIPALEAAGFELVSYPEPLRWAFAWTSAAGDLMDIWRATLDGPEQLCVWLCTDVGDAVSKHGFEPWEATERVCAGLVENLPKYGRVGALKPYLRKWLEANSTRDRLRAKGLWLVEANTDYAGLVLSEEARPVQAACEKWAWLVLMVERLSGNTGWVSPEGWLETLRGLTREAAA
jgi:hypothetical protein